MKLLAIETATEACSVALWLDGEVTERHRVAPRRHAELVLADAQALLDETGLALGRVDGIAFGRGPGSFTGVRIAAAVTQGLALATGLPVAPVSTLAALAGGAMRETGAERVIAALDARMREVYLGCFEPGGGLPVAVTEEGVMDPALAPLPKGKGWLGAGHGFDALDGVLRARLGTVLDAVEADRLPRAYDVAALGAAMLERGEGVPAERVLPVYLREKVAEKPKSG